MQRGSTCSIFGLETPIFTGNDTDNQSYVAGFLIQSVQSDTTRNTQGVEYVDRYEIMELTSISKTSVRRYQSSYQRKFEDPESESSLNMCWTVKRSFTGFKWNLWVF